MSAGVEGLFTSALGLAPPWEVAKVELDTARRRIDFEVHCSAKVLACPHCGAAVRDLEAVAATQPAAHLPRRERSRFRGTQSRQRTQTSRPWTVSDEE